MGLGDSKRVPSPDLVGAHRRQSASFLHISSQFPLLPNVVLTDPSYLHLHKGDPKATGITASDGSDSVANSILFYSLPAAELPSSWRLAECCGMGAVPRGSADGAVLSLGEISHGLSCCLLWEAGPSPSTVRWYQSSQLMGSPQEVCFLSNCLVCAHKSF